MQVHGMQAVIISSAYMWVYVKGPADQRQGNGWQLTKTI
jgi:hypothetical protein